MIDPKPSELIEALEAGDMGSVEFFELALHAGLSLIEINEALEQAADEL